jgi:hypothetical protein
LAAAFSVSAAGGAFAQSATRSIPQATVPQSAVPPAPAADSDVEIHFNDGRDYVGDAVVRQPKRIVIVPADKSTTTFVNGVAPTGAYVVIPDGPGKITYASGATLQAVFAKGLANGNGDYEATGFSFKGTFQDGKPVNGLATYADGSSYTGDFVDGLPSGHGTYTSTGRVERADGTWTAGAFSGGTVTFRDGARFAGMLDANGKINGPARFELPDGAVLTGSFVSGDYAGRLTERWTHDVDGTLSRRTLTVDVSPPNPSLSGPAKLTFTNGNQLIGRVSEGEFQGPGAFVYRDGSAFKGTLSSGRFTGPISWTNGRGVTIAGYVRRGRMQGPAVLRTAKGATLHGMISNDGYFFTFTGPVDSSSRPNGHGTYGYADGEKLTGTYSHGRLSGPFVDRITNGTIFYVNVRRPSYDLVGPARVVLPNGDVAVGNLARNGDLEGAGTYAVATSHELFTGTWVDGTFHIIHS